MLRTLRLAILLGALAVPGEAAAALMDWSFAGTLANSHRDGYALAGEHVAMQFTVDTSRPDLCAADSAGLYTGVFSNASLTIGNVSFTPMRSQFGAVEINAPLGDCGRMVGGHLLYPDTLFRLFDVFKSDTPTAPMLVAEVNFVGGYQGYDELPINGDRVWRLFFGWGQGNVVVNNPFVTVTPRPVLDTVTVPAPPAVALLPLALGAVLWRRRRE